MNTILFIVVVIVLSLVVLYISHNSANFIFFEKKIAHKFKKEIPHDSGENLYNRLVCAMFVIYFSCFVLILYILPQTRHYLYTASNIDAPVHLPAISSPDVSVVPEFKIYKFNNENEFNERKNKISLSMEEQQKTIAGHHQLAEELNHVYTTSDNSSAETFVTEPVQEKVISESIKPSFVAQGKESDSQYPTDEAKDKQRSYKDKLTESSPRAQGNSHRSTEASYSNERSYHAPPNHARLCNRIQRQIDVNIRNQAIFNKPIGQPTGISWSRGILFITPEARNGNCIKYSIQIGEGKNAVYCRHNEACINF